MSRVNGPCPLTTIRVGARTMAAEYLTKVCTKCGVDRPHSDYYPLKKGRFGINPACKFCVRRDASKWYEKNSSIVLKQKAEQREQNKEQWRERAREYYWSNPERPRKASREWFYKNKEAIRVKTKKKYAANSEKIKANVAEWREKNKDRVKAYSASYIKRNLSKLSSKNAADRAARLLATPAWSETAQIASLYIEAGKAGLTVDHIVPLKSKVVCGLHVLSNLRIIPMEENSSKGNRHWPDMP
jgi:hypothetical protein